MHRLIEPATFMLAAFRFKAPRGIPGVIFLTIVVLVVAGVVYAVRHLQTNRPGPPVDDWQDSSGSEGKDRSPWR